MKTIFSQCVCGKCGVWIPSINFNYQDGRIETINWTFDCICGITKKQKDKPDNKLIELRKKHLEQRERLKKDPKFLQAYGKFKKEYDKGKRKYRRSNHEADSNNP